MEHGIGIGERTYISIMSLIQQQMYIYNKIHVLIITHFLLHVSAFIVPSSGRIFLYAQNHVCFKVKRKMLQIYVITKGNTSSEQTVGRPKSQWEDDVRNDLKKTKRIKWAEQAQDRLKWKDIIEKAKALPEL
jgi:hypothetical protein